MRMSDWSSDVCSSDLPGDENGRSRGSMPGVSIGVPAGYDAYGHGARRRKRMPIADTVARINGGYADDFGRKRHGRPEAETGAGAVGKRRSAIQADSGTHPLLGLIRPFGPPADRKSAG